MIFSINSNSFSYLSLNPLFSFVACSLSAIKISQVFAKQIHLLNLSRAQAQTTKKIFLCIIQLSAAVSSILYPKLSTVTFMAVCVGTIAASRYFQKPTTDRSPLEDPLSRFKILDGMAKSKRKPHFAIQTEKAKILNTHPEIPTFSYFESFEEMVLFAKTYGVSKLNLANTSLSHDQIAILTTEIPSLLYLDIAGCDQITDLSLELISSRLTRLTHLNISDCKGIHFDGIKAVTHLTSLTYLDLSDCSVEINDVNLQLISFHLSRLTHLKINHCKNFSSIGIQSLKDLTNLTHLEMQWCRGLDDTSVQILAHHLKQLTYLNINNARDLSPIGFQALEAFKNLTHLEMEFCQELDDVSFHLITPYLTQLTYLNISNSNLSSNGIKAIVHLKNLSYLDVSRCNGLDDTSLQFITPKLEKLSQLIMRACNNVESPGVQAIAHLSTLTHLDVFVCKGMDDISLQVIAPKLTRLTHFNAFGCKNLQSEGIKTIAHFKNLTHLNLSFNQSLDDSALQALVPHLTNLSHLEISDSRCITKAGIQALAKLVNLTHLDLKDTNLDDESLQNLTSSLKKLSYLDISLNKNLSSKGIQALASFSNLNHLCMSDCDAVDSKSLQVIAPHLSKLSHLDLYACKKLKPEAIESLTFCAALTHLDLSDCNINDLSLSQLDHLKKLTDLNIKGCTNISISGLRALASCSKLSRLNLSDRLYEDACSVLPTIRISS